jgi:NodT family efflux transporter outer membrane factor (OMF) lipoprotein
MLPARIPAALFTTASLLAGCTLGPDYVRPETPLSDQYVHQASPDRRQADAQAETDLAEWWAGFGDPRLTRYVTLALEQNLDLAQATARVAQARAGFGATNAALLPHGNVGGQATRSYSSVETPLGQVLDATPGYDRYGQSYDLNFGATWELDVFGGLQHDREATLAEYQASMAGEAATRLTVAAQTADIYVGIRGLQARLDIARRQVQTQQDLLALVRLLHDKGLAAAQHVSQAEAALAEARAAVPVLDASLDAAMNALDVMLGSPPGANRQDMAQRGELPLAPRIVDIGTPVDLLRRRPDVIAAERRLAAAHARIGVAMAEYYPKVSLGGLVGSATANSSGNLFSGDASQGAALLGLRWRLFDFARIDAQIEQANGRTAELLAAYRLAALRACEDVENALSSLVKREEQAALLAGAVDSLDQARTISSAAYHGGVASKVDLLQAEKSLLRAADAQVQARTEATRAAVAAFKALGGGWHHGQTELAATGQQRVP